MFNTHKFKINAFDKCPTCRFSCDDKLACLKGKTLTSFHYGQVCLEYREKLNLKPNQMVGAKIKALLLYVSDNDGFVTYREKSKEFLSGGQKYLVLSEEENLEMLSKVYYDEVYSPLVGNVLKQWDLPIPFVIPNFEECFGKYIAEAKIRADVVVRLNDEDVKMYITNLGVCCG